ncbi:MAG: 3-methyl-2-oxobutanoate hydroxymethyltransferase [Nitrososphaeraceae archaeon]
MKKLTVHDILLKKSSNEKLTVLTAYDYPMAFLCDNAGIDIILVGDSAGMVVLGYPSTIPVRMDEMLLFVGAVGRATSHSLITADMPFGSYQTSINIALDNAIKLIKAGSDAVKLEGGSEIFGTVKALVDSGIPVMGHVGLKPQTSVLWDGYRTQGSTVAAARKIISDAKSLEQAGAFSIVLEMVTDEVTEIVSKSTAVPIIGIGSGTNCDGQVLVLHDILGLYRQIKPRFVKRYLDLSEQIHEALSNYINDVRSGVFPSKENIFHMSEDEYSKLKDTLGKEDRMNE